MSVEHPDFIGSHVPAKPENIDRSSYAIRKTLHPRLKQLVKDLGLRSVGDLLAMLATNDTASKAALEQVAKAHTMGRDLQEKLAADPELQAKVLEVLKRG